MTVLKWKRRKEARPSELLDAAVGVFAEKGFASARLEDIAARAGVSKGTVYLYYDSKEAILRALIKAIPVARIEGFEKLAEADAGPADQTLRSVLQLFGAMIRDPVMIQFPRLVIGESGNFPWIAETYRQEVISRGVEMLSGIIAKGIAQGQFRDVDAKRAAFAAIAPILFVAIWRTTFERFDDTQLDAQAFIDQHIATFLRGLAREEEK
ncbi:MAG: TetR/AcrR family transcriptional regulator [Alphaproteobacteria bacterium]|nr:TetR/AcrR family transcriptional regulator [Alphaproteobacteria bacterium]